jgi:hypothetical protein
MLASVYIAGICLAMFVSLQTLLRFGPWSELEPVVKHLTEATCYGLSIVFLAPFVIEAARVLGP